MRPAPTVRAPERARAPGGPAADRIALLRDVASWPSLPISAHADVVAISGVMLAIMFTHASVIEGPPPLLAPTCSASTVP